MEISIAPASEADVKAIAQLIDEMDAEYGVTVFEPLDRSIARIQEVLFQCPTSAKVLLARDRTRIVGMAVYVLMFPAVGVSRSLFVKELYVRQDARRQGIASQLMQYIFQLAIEHHYSRVEWTTDLTNISAQQFYESIGVPVFPQKLFYRVEGDLIQEVWSRLSE